MSKNNKPTEHSCQSQGQLTKISYDLISKTKRERSDSVQKYKISRNQLNRCDSMLLLKEEITEYLEMWKIFHVHG